MVGVIILLITISLNISNQAINSLTMENRGPVLSCKLDGQDLSVVFLGKNHVYSGDKLNGKVIVASNYLHLAYNEIKDYLYKIWNISNIILFDQYD
ncbi:MAG TPA: hypothetical protein VFC73_06120 [Syntrophomonadaceae bacterium]|nr:hypothetical protein [Syntrophomonadaceae bacterium]